MLKKSIILCIFILLGLTSQINSQVNFNIHSDDWDDWNVNIWDWYSGSHPFIEFNYGLTQVKNKNLFAGFGKIGMAEIKVGYADYDNWEEPIIEIDDKFVFVSFTSKDLNDKIEVDEFETKSWRMGLGFRKGYGYEFGGIAFIPYFESGIAWTKLDVVDYNSTEMIAFHGVSAMANDLNTLERFNNNFRFGTTNETGIKFQFAQLLSLNASYSADVIFPRHMVWYHLGSFVIESAGNGAIDYFVEEVIDSSPIAGPIVYLLLKSGFTYGFHVLKREQMNWPFETEAPVTMETIKFGVTFTF
ncbi:MAG: hypothetical protein K9J16_04570 [Melioribacteraceae bacterium]|nr:hypothetical protein [Melioribacteraceae bacterium]MCF8354735.1 hypothetical protein [Melioribacteraceae bacterium]MCF8393243.1 hypothetical protein [Melioribacteraceae bacterium]MCF8417544.1 hypothetical protein [Melioribacteraceae bacterium]